MKIFLRPAAGGRSAVDLGERIGGGGAGDVYRVIGRSGEVVKIYRTDDIRRAYAKKIEAMLATPPVLPPLQKKGTRLLHQLAWPTAIAEDKSRNFLGFAMPEIDFGEAVSLVRMLQKRSRETSGLPAAYSHRIVAAFNAALLVKLIHERGHHIIDLKPGNIRVYKKTMALAFVDCDGFSIQGADKTRYEADQFTEDYIAPENVQRRPAELGEEQDRFALAVVIFRLFNNGLHPYQGRLNETAGGEQPPTIHKAVAAGLYSYAQVAHPRIAPAFATVHEFFPPKLREYFDRAFSSPENRPSASEWVKLLRTYADPSRRGLQECKLNPQEHGHFGYGCGWCDLDSRLSQPGQVGRTTRRSAPGTRKAGAGPAAVAVAAPVVLAGLVHARGKKWVFAALMGSAISMVLVEPIDPKLWSPGPLSDLEKRCVQMVLDARKMRPPDAVEYCYDYYADQRDQVTHELESRLQGLGIHDVAIRRKQNRLQATGHVGSHDEKAKMRDLMVGDSDSPSAVVRYMQLGDSPGGPLFFDDQTMVHRGRGDERVGHRDAWPEIGVDQDRHHK